MQSSDETISSPFASNHPLQEEDLPFSPEDELSQADFAELVKLGLFDLGAGG